MFYLFVLLSNCFFIAHNMLYLTIGFAILPDLVFINLGHLLTVFISNILLIIDVKYKQKELIIHKILLLSHRHVLHCLHCTRNTVQYLDVNGSSATQIFGMIVRFFCTNLLSIKKIYTIFLFESYDTCRHKNTY